MTSKNLGDILLEQGVIGRDTLDRALQLQNRRLGEILIEEKLADPVAIANALKFQARSSENRRANRLNIEAQVLDRILAQIESLEDRFSDHHAQAPLFANLRQSVEMLLLESVDPLLKKAQWAALQAANELGKRIEVRLSGQGLVIDRLLAEDLSDMLLHLVRNAVDHGLEDPQERVSAGKSPIGELKVGVAISLGKLFVEVTDDGRGIAEDQVYEKAKAKGLVSEPKESLSREQLFRLLFTPGFSTAKKLTSFSGRGVGLDVVEANLMRLGGEVQVQSSPGKGATFRLSLPLRSARLSVIPLRAGQNWVAVDASNVARVDRAEKLDGHFFSARLFDPQAETPSLPAVSVVASDGASWIFDEICQPEFALVKEASAFAQGSHGVIGNARLQDGRPVLILDLTTMRSLAPKF